MAGAALLRTARAESDIATVVAAGAVDPVRAREDLVALVGRDDPRVERWDASTR